MTAKPPLVVIAGPTASGKSALAMALARLTPATIVNADASQVYRDLRVLTARPSAEDEAEIPHALFGHVDGATPHSAAAWANEARAAIAEVHASGRLPVLTGGSGMYIRTLIDGIAPVPEIDPAVRAAVRAMPVAEAHAALAEEDAEAAARLHPADSTRIARALEVVRSTGTTLRIWQAQREGGIADQVRVVPMILMPRRSWLNGRIAERFARMMRDGQHEVAALLARELDPALPVMRAIGVREIAGFQRGLLTAAEAQRAGELATRQYAKRQETWFRNQPPPDWPRESSQLDSVQIDIIAIKLREIALTE